MANKFCQNLVESSINEIFVREDVYSQIFNDMNQISECDPNKPYFSNQYQINFSLNKKNFNKIKKCYDSF